MQPILNLFDNYTNDHNNLHNFSKGPFLLNNDSGKGDDSDNSSISSLAKHFDLLDVLETAWPRVWDDGNQKDSSFLEGMLEEQFKVQGYGPSCNSSGLEFIIPAKM